MALCCVRNLLMLTPLLVLMAVPKPVAAVDPSVCTMPTQAATNHDLLAAADQFINKLGLNYLADSKYDEALKCYQSALKIFRYIKNRNGEAYALNGIARVYHSQSSYDKASNYYQKALSLFREVKDQQGEAYVLNSLGFIHHSQSKYREAIDFFQQAKDFFEKTKDFGGEAKSLNGLALVYRSQVNFSKAIEYSQKALRISRESKDLREEANALNYLGLNYYSLAKYSTALEYYSQALLIFQEVKNRYEEANVLDNLSLIYGLENGDYATAVKYASLALKIFQEIKNRNGEGYALSNLGLFYWHQKKDSQAIMEYDQALTIFRAVNDHNGEADVLYGLALAQPSVKSYERSLSVARKNGNRQREARSLEGIGQILAKQQQPELAIVFYKQSVNVREGIRQDLRTLDLSLQESYTQSVAGTYRQLADLLIAQGRIGEAQQVLERLKLQELNDFTKGTRATTTVAAVGFSPVETQVKSKYTSLITFGSKFYDCDQQQPRCPQHSELKNQYQNLSKEFQAFVETIKQQLRDSRLTQVNTSTQQFLDGASRVVNAHPNSILIYPLVLPDKTRLLWASKGGALSKTATCPLGEKALYSKVSQFQTLISKRGDETQLKALGKELYECLVKPIEPELTANGIKHLIFVPDRATNYIPMGALFDGQQYLIQRFAISTVIAASLTDTDSRLPAPAATPILALGLSQAKGNYSALPNVEAELKAIVKQANTTGIYPGQIFLNQQFTKDALEDNIRGHRIIHIATHGEFKPENPRSSYFLLGNGIPYPIPDVQALRDLKGVDLVVLSACKTGLGGADGLGLEVSGISSFFMGDARDRAKAVMASLWDVNDVSTSLLMQQFYQNLATGKMTKAEALRQAQLSLMGSSGATQTTRGDSFKLPSTDGSKPAIAHNYSHPYYWAPFILIGNGL